MSREQRRTPHRNNVLLARYPALHDTYREETAARRLGYTVYPNLHVRQANTELYFRSDEYVDAGPHMLKEPGLIGTLFEYCYPVKGSQHGEILSPIHFDEGSSFYRSIQTCELFETTISDWVAPGEAGEDPFEAIDSIIWVSRETWYPEGSDLSQVFLSPDPVKIDVAITLYIAPPGGWRQLDCR
jgi:hypothetical protein